MRSELTPFIVFVTVVAVATAAIAWAVPPPLGNLSIIAGDNTTPIADNRMTTDNLVVNENETLPWEHHSPPSTIIEQGSGIETANYIIFHDDETPKNYYAKSGDNGEIVFGGADAATVINDAITSLGATGGAVVLVKGTYEITAPVNLASNVALVGQGAGTVLRVPNGHDAALNVISGSGIDYVLVANLKVDGNKANQAVGNMHGIYFDTVTHSKVVDCWVEDMNNTAYGIYLLDSSEYNTITGNTCRGGEQHGVNLSSSNHNTITGNTFQGNDRYGINLSSSNNNTVTGNTCQGNLIGIYVDASSNNTVAGNTCQGNSHCGICIHGASYNTVAGNTCQGNGDPGIILDGTSNHNTITGNTCQGNSGYGGIVMDASSYNTVTGNTCRGNDESGINLYAADYNTVAGNTFQGNGTHGIWLEDAYHNTVEGNTVEGNSQDANDTHDGIMVEGDSDYNNIQGNTVRQGVGDNKQRYGINIAAATCDGNLVANNGLYSAGATANFSDAGIGTISHLNRGWDDNLDLGTGGIISSQTVTRHIVIPSCNFGLPPTDPPVVDVYGICQVLEFTVNTDKAYYKFHVRDDWVPGTDILVHAHWTRSSTGAVDSGKTVKWQMKYLAIDGVSQNVNAGEVTLSVQDTYDSASMTDQITYETDDVTVPAAALSPGDFVLVELMAITPTGTALSDPACAALGVTYTVYQVPPA